MARLARLETRILIVLTGVEGGLGTSRTEDRGARANGTWVFGTIIMHMDGSWGSESQSQLAMWLLTGMNSKGIRFDRVELLLTVVV